MTEEQLQSVETNAELESESLARWFEGEQESIRLLSAHKGVTPSNQPVTDQTLARQLTQAPDELASLHVVERATEQPSNGTTERIVSSTDDVEGEELAATSVDWRKNADGEEVPFSFNGTEDILVSWVYLDGGNMSVAIASPTRDGNHVLVGEYHPSTRIAKTADAFDGANTVVLGGVSAYVMFEKDSPNEFRPYESESTDSGYSVVISDDGPGIPATELDSLAAGTETDLRHSRGLGLWELKWGVDVLDGEISFENEAETTVRIRLPDLGENDSGGAQF